MISTTFKDRFEEFASISNDRGEQDYLYLNEVDYITLLSEIDKEVSIAFCKENDKICQILGKALDYPWFKDDQKNFPGATEADGVCIAEADAECLAIELVKLMAEKDKQVAEERKEILACIKLCKKDLDLYYGYKTMATKECESIISKYSEEK